MIMQLEGKITRTYTGGHAGSANHENNGSAAPHLRFDKVPSHATTAGGDMVGHGMNSRKLSRPTGPVPSMEAFQQVPPLFDFVEQHQQHAVLATAPAPPLFDFLEHSSRCKRALLRRLRPQWQWM